MRTSHGSAQWATAADLAQAGMDKATDTGLFLGRSCGRDIYHNDTDHILTIAPPGAGKSSNLIFPVLLSYRGSVVVTDPKAELAPVTIEARRRMGHRIVVLNPWSHELEQAGIHLPDDGFNPLGILQDGPSLFDDVLMLGEYLCPTDPKSRDPFFANKARAFLCGLMFYMVKNGEAVTLPRLRSLVRKDTPEMIDLAVEMDKLSEQSDFPVLAEYAREIFGNLESEKTWSSVRSHAETVTNIYATGSPLGEHVSRNEFDPTDLKREDITVYVIVPSNRRDAAKDWFSLVLAIFGDAVGKFGRPRPVLFLAEEFGNIGQVGNIGRMLGEYRGAGLRCWLLCQTQHQITDIYGQQNGQNIWAQCGIHQFFRVNDPLLTLALSKRLGEFTRDVTTYNRKTFFGGDRTEATTMHGEAPPSERMFIDSLFGKGVALNQNEAAAPLMRPDEIERLPRHEQLIFKAGMPPIKGELVYYKTRGTWTRAANANPYDPPAGVVERLPLPRLSLPSFSSFNPRGNFRHFVWLVAGIVVFLMAIRGYRP